jgi:regulator of replication initiation timing
MKSERILEIEQKIRQLEREQTDSDQIMQSMQERARVIQKELRRLRSHLSHLKPNKLVVSEHAVLRYAERFHAIPVEDIRKEIEEKLKGAKDLQELHFQGFVVKNNTVITYKGPQSATPRCIEMPSDELPLRDPNEEGPLY